MAQNMNSVSVVKTVTANGLSSLKAVTREAHDINSSVCDKMSNEFAKDLICHICREPYKNPKLLPCLHTFCKSCLEETIENAHDGILLIKCRLCSWGIEVNKKDVDGYLGGLPSDFVAVNLLDSWAVETLEEDLVISCAHCSAQAVSRCSECVIFFCMNCERAHRRTKGTKNHRVCSLALLDLQASDSTRKIKYCESHTGEEITCYCKTCHLTICNDCTFLDHPKSTHVIVTLAVVSRVHRRRLAELLSSVRRKLPFLKRTLHDIDTVLETMPDHADAVAREIARNTESIIHSLQRRQEQLLDDLAKLCLYKANTLQEQKSRIQAELELLQANCETTERILKNGSDSEISSINSLLRDRIRSLNKMPLDIEAEESAEFGYDNEGSELTEMIENHGKVYLLQSASSLKVLGDGLCEAAVGKVAMFSMAMAKHCQLSPQDIDVRIETPDSVILACDVTHSDGLFNVFYNPKVPGEHEISITVRGEHLPDSPICVNVKKGHMTLTKAHARCTILGGERGSTPGCFDQVCDVTVRNNGNILAVDSLNHRVQEFDCKGNFVAQFGKKGEDLGQLLYPAGIAISHEGHVILTEHGNHRVQVFTPDGLHLWSFGNQGDSEGSMDHPTGVAVDEDGQLVIADKHSHRVLVFDQNGKLKRHFGCYGNQRGQFDRPMYVAITQDGEIVVTDSGNHRVQVFDESGRFRLAFGSSGTADGEFCYPSGITIDACGYVFVADKSNRIQVFSPEFEFVTKLDTRDRGHGNLDCPMGLDYSPEGRIAVADKGNHQVKVLYY